MAKKVDQEMEEYFETMPFLNKIGIKEATIDNGTAEFYIPFDETNTNHAVVHGGVMATLIDATVAGAIHSDAEAGEDEVTPLTIDMTVNYHAPVFDGDLVATASLVNRGRTIAVGDAEIRCDGELVSSGRATYFQKWK